LDNKNFYLRTIFYFIIGLTIYFLLFDIILPANKILPKLSLIFESFFELFKHYNLFTGIAITSSVIYVSLSLILIIILIFDNISSFLFSFKSFIKVPFFLMILFFSFWFGDAIWAEFLFSFIIIFIHLSYKGNSLKNEKANKVLEFAKLNSFSRNVIGNIKGEFAKSLLFQEMRKTHFYLWTFILIYEFIIKTGGIGTVLEITVNNNDYIGFIALSLIIYVLILFGDYLYILIKNKINN
jgi:ABC-type nitrate/sulfonate/bicarbonate transport system permease component